MSSKETSKETSNETSTSEMLTCSPPMFSNIVLKSRHDAEIDLDVFFNIIPVVKIHPDQIKDTDINHVFISIRKHPYARGYRSPDGIKSFSNFDYYCDRPFHFKISSNCITIVGGKSIETTRRVICEIYHYLTKVNENWERFKDLPDREIDTVYRVIKEDGPVPSYFTELMKLFHYTVTTLIAPDEDVNDRLNSIYPTIRQSLYKRSPKFESLYNCNTIFNYRLPENVILHEKAMLLDSLGYNVSFHNFLTHKRLNARYIKNDAKYDFTLQEVGTIKQNSSQSIENCTEMYVKFVTDLGYRPYTPGVPSVNRTPAKTSISYRSLDKTESCKKIFEYFFGDERLH